MSVPFRPSVASQQEQEDPVILLDKAWEDVQQRTFTKWVNNKLSSKSIDPIESLLQLQDGVPLIQLLEIIGDESLGRYNKNAKLRIQRVENLNKALEFIKYRGVNLTNIGAEDIVDGNLKLILGMIWTIILRFTISEINEEGLTAKEGLLLWCQRKTAPYEDVHVKDFTYSWVDGLALCALIHRHRPDLLDYDSLNKSDRHGNTALAFDVAESQLGIPKLLEVADLCDMSKPDERSVMTYVAQYFHAFSSQDKIGTAGRRVTMFADVMRSVWDMEQDYERRVRELIAQVEQCREKWSSTSFDDTYTSVKKQSLEFDEYKASTKRSWVMEKHDLGALLGNIQTKLKTYGLTDYNPPAGVTPEDLESAWVGLTEAEVDRRRSINRKIREIKDKLERDFAKAANDLQARLDTLSFSLTNLADMEVEKQLDQTKSLLSTDLPPLANDLDKLGSLDKLCREANVEENDHTVYSFEDLEFDLSQVRSALNKKISFLENQMVARNMTALTPAQLEEFESAFRHFDTDSSNVLDKEEFKACLASFGNVWGEEEFDGIFSQCAGEGGQAVSFENFINFAVSITEDRATPEQLRQSFKTIAGDRPFVTEMDLKVSGLPVETLQYLTATMPLADGAEEEGNGSDRYDYVKYVSDVFQQR